MQKSLEGLLVNGHVIHNVAHTCGCSLLNHCLLIVLFKQKTKTNYIISFNYSVIHRCTTKRSENLIKYELDKEKKDKIRKLH